VHHSLNGSTVRSFSISRRAHGHIEHSMPAKVATTFMGDTTLYTQLSDQTIDFTATHFRVVHPDSLRQNATTRTTSTAEGQLLFTRTTGVCHPVDSCLPPG